MRATTSTLCGPFRRCTVARRPPVPPAAAGHVSEPVGRARPRPRRSRPRADGRTPFVGKRSWPRGLGGDAARTSVAGCATGWTARPGPNSPSRACPEVLTAELRLRASWLCLPACPTWSAEQVYRHSAPTRAGASTRAAGSTKRSSQSGWRRLQQTLAGALQRWTGNAAAAARRIALLVGPAAGASSATCWRGSGRRPGLAGRGAPGPAADVLTAMAHRRRRRDVRQSLPSRGPGSGGSSNVVLGPWRAADRRPGALSDVRLRPGRAARAPRHVS